MEFLEVLNTKYFEWAPLMDVRHCRLLKGKNVLDEMDVAIIEGGISSQKEVERVLEIRRLAKRVVAIGSCAITGAPNNYRNYFDAKTLEEIKPILERFGHRERVTGIGEVVKVDAEVPGCPIMHPKFIEVLEGYMKEFGVLAPNETNEGEEHA